MARGRSEEAHERVLNAALELFGERGIDAASMDAIAQTSGVSKATIYNHWPNKEALLLDVMLMVNGLDRDSEDVDTGDVCRDLATVLCRRPPDAFDAARSRMTPALIAYSAVHQEFGEVWRHRVMEPPRICLKRILRRGIKRGKFAPSLDVDAAMALLLGPVLYGYVFHMDGHTSKQEKAGLDFGQAAAETFWRAHGIGEDKPRRLQPRKKRQLGLKP